jgi:hypothetical protein
MFIVLLFILFINIEHASAQPQFTQRAEQIIEALFDQRAFGSDDDRRALTRTLIEQLVCEFPNDGYGGKSADPSRPFSKDVIARRMGNTLWGWDWQNGATRRRQVKTGDPANDLTGQHFIPVPCVPHLGSPPPNPGPPPPPPSQDLDVLIDLLATLERKIDALEGQNERIYEDLKRHFEIVFAQHQNANAHHASEENKGRIGIGDRVLQTLAVLFAAAGTAVASSK